MSADRSSRRAGGRWIIFWVGLISILSAVGWMRLRIDTSLEPLLPQNNQGRQTIAFLRDSSFASKAILWFRLTGNGSLNDLFAAADDAEKRLDPKLISRVIHPPGDADTMQEMFGLLDHAGELLNQDDLKELDQATAPDALRRRMRECYVQLLKPEGSFMEQIIQRDPLGVSSRILARLYALTNGLGYRIEVKNGYFVNPDERQLILIMETNAAATSLASSKALVDHLNAISAAAPPGIQITPICGQMHTEQNDQLMRRDMNWAGTIDAAGFLLLFLLVCRDWRVAAVFTLPVVAIVLTLGLCALIYPKLSAMVMGLSATMAGSAVDYGIFVFMAVWMGNHPQGDIRRIRRYLLLSLLTTLGVFVAFLFSAIPAYRQLGWITSLSLIVSLLGAVFVLPRLIRPGGRVVAVKRAMSLHHWGQLTVPVMICGVLLVVAGVFVAKRVRYDPDLSKLDGVSPAVLQNEKDFQHNFSRSDSDLAMVVVTGNTLDEAEQANDSVYQLMKGQFAEGEFVSLSSFWPSAATRAANLARWKQFWTDQRIASLRRDLAAAAEPFGFASDAFDPFFQSLTHPPTGEQSRQILLSIQEQFIARSGTQYQILSYFEDTEEHVTIARRLLHDWPNAQVISRRALGQAFAESAVSETRLLLGISVSFIVVSLLVLTRNVVKSFIIMLPAITGVIAMLAALSLLGLSMSMVTVIAGILIIGLCSDYGIFAVFAWDEGQTILGQGMTSMHLSSITTLIGTGAMLFAHHPALFLVGVSMTSGLLAGYLTAFLMIPGICFLLDRIKARRAA